MAGTPKSGEQLVQIAPRQAVANIAIMVSGILGKTPAMQSPGLTLSLRNAWASWETR